jgi:prepilin-type N-terminal cleavage/methylation domain-containing protein
MTPITLTRRPRRAFTLLELMLVVAIAGVMSALAVFTINQVSQSSRERGAARGVSALIKRARSLSMQEHRLVAVVATAASVKLQTCSARYGAPTCVGATTLADLSGAVVRLGGQDALGVSLTPPATQLVFGPNGFPLSAATWTYVLNHPDTPGSATVFVTAGGDVRVQ